MINLSERQSVILELLRESGRSMTGAELSDLLGVSPRTLRNDIGRMNRLGGVALVESGGSGYAVNATAYRDVIELGPRVASVVEDDARMLVYLLDVSECSIYDIAVDCYTSESVIRASLPRLQPQFAHCGLELIAEGSQIIVRGEEVGRRRLLGELVRAALNTTVGSHQRLRQLLPQVNLGVVEAAIERSLQGTDIDLDDISRQNLIVNVAICVQRAGAGIPPASAAEAASVPDRGVSAAAGRLIEELTAAFPQRQLSSKDTDRIRRIMDVAAAGPTTTPPDASGEPLSVDEVVLQAIEECITHFNLDVDRERLISSLTLHTRRLVARSNSFVYFRSGLRESLRTKSPFLYDVAVYLAHLISGSLGLRVTDDEISLLAIYLGLYADHPDSSADTVSVTIVCPRYQTLREWLLTKLVEHYGERIRIVDVVMSIRDAEASDCDLIITAMGGTSHATPVVEISALCSELDLDVISAALVKARETRLQHRTAALLSRFLDPDLFFVDLQFPDATSTISFLSDQLIATGKVPPAFAQSVLTREDYSSTAFSHRFAVPHSMEFLAKQTTIAVLIPKQPINWGESDVVMVLMLAINPDDYTDFSAAYQPLIHLLCQADTFAELRRLRDFDAFRSYLTERFKAGA